MNLDSGIGRGITVYSHLSIDKSTIQIDTGLSYEEVCLLEIRLRGGTYFYSHAATEAQQKLNFRPE